MRMCKVVVGLALGIATIATARAWADETTATNSASVSVVQTVTLKSGARGEINYTTGAIMVRGRGAPLRGSTGGQRELTAEKAAMAEAYAALAAVAAGVRVTSGIDVHNCELQDEQVKVAIEANIQHAAPVEGKGGWNEEKGIYEVYMTMPIYGPDSLFAALGAAKVQELQKKDSESKLPPVIAPKPKPSPEGQTGPFTGLIIDARGLGMKPCMSPKIKKSDNSEVWGTMDFSSHEETIVVVEQKGIANWQRSLEGAKSDARAGNNPLIIKAIGKQGAYDGNAVVSDEDAQRILDENKQAGFLEKLNVVFLI